MPSCTLPSMSFSQALGNGDMNDHLPCIPNTVDSLSPILVSPMTPSILNYPTIIADMSSAAPWNWDLNSHQQGANMAGLRGYLEPQIPRYTLVNSHEHTYTDINLGNLRGSILPAELPGGVDL